MDLYARDSKGRINQWSCYVVKDIHSIETMLYVEEGLLDGAKTLTTRVIKTGKNLGKMNATTPFEQACKQLESRVEKKKKQGYKSLEDLGIPSILELEEALPMLRTDANGLLKPMKAQPYYKVKTVGGIKIKTNEPVIKFPCFGQPKLNGFRVMCRWEEVEEGEGLFKTKVEQAVFRSKEGLRYKLPHIEKEFTEDMFLSINGTKLIFDGEMYIHGEILSQISSAVTKPNTKTPLLKFYIFDLAVENISQRERIVLLSNIYTKYFFNERPSVNFVQTFDINTNEEAQIWTDQWIREGYEGGIFRDKKAFYQFGKRPQTMTKLKRSEDAEFRIIDVIGGDNSPELGVFVCLAENGLSFNCTPEGDVEQKKEYLINKSKYIGKNLTVRFFERTKDGKPFHAVGVAVRDYE